MSLALDFGLNLLRRRPKNYPRGEGNFCVEMVLKFVVLLCQEVKCRGQEDLLVLKTFNF